MIGGEEDPGTVAQAVEVNIIESEGDEFFLQPLTAGGFAEWRRGNFSEFALPAAELHLLVVKIEK